MNKLVRLILGVPEAPLAAPAPSPAPAPNPQVIEQYKAKLADLGNLGARQTAMTAYYVSIVSALFGILAFKDKSLKDIDPFVVAFISGVGILVSLLWLQGVRFFSNLFRAKLHVLQLIETQLPFETFRLEFEKRKEGSPPVWLKWPARIFRAIHSYKTAPVGMGGCCCLNS